jgi:hypothetical protein
MASPGAGSSVFLSFTAKLCPQFRQRTFFPAMSVFTTTLNPQCSHEV